MLEFMEANRTRLKPEQSTSFHNALNPLTSELQAARAASVTHFIDQIRSEQMWWAEMERIEPIQFTFFLYIPPELKYPALDLREHSAEAVAAYIQEHAPKQDDSRA
jgi:hypothetical protein